MGRYLLDSSAFIRAQENITDVRPEAREVMKDRNNTIYISLGALWEMGIKAANGKLPFYAEMIATGSQALLADLQVLNPRYWISSSTMPSRRRACRSTIAIRSTA